jgi:hypothetical protein
MGTPIALSKATELASNVPRPSETGPRVATVEATTKLGNAIRNDTFCPTACNIAHNVAASSRKIVA